MKMLKWGDRDAKVFRELKQEVLNRSIKWNRQSIKNCTYHILHGTKLKSKRD